MGKKDKKDKKVGGVKAGAQKKKAQGHLGWISWEGARQEEVQDGHRGVEQQLQRGIQRR